MKQEAFFLTFKELSVVRNSLRPESWPLIYSKHGAMYGLVLASPRNVGIIVRLS